MIALIALLSMGCCKKSQHQKCRERSADIAEYVVKETGPEKTADEILATINAAQRELNPMCESGCKEACDIIHLTDKLEAEVHRLKAEGKR